MWFPSPHSSLEMRLLYCQLHDTYSMGSRHEKSLFPRNALTRLHTWVYARESAMGNDLGPYTQISPRLRHEWNAVTSVNGRKVISIRKKIVNIRQNTSVTFKQNNFENMNLVFWMLCCFSNSSILYIETLEVLTSGVSLSHVVLWAFLVWAEGASERARIKTPPCLKT